MGVCCSGEAATVGASGTPGKDVTNITPGSDKIHLYWDLTDDNCRAIKALQGARVLLVEDNEINQELAMALLQDNGLRVDAVNNGQQALDRLRGHRYDGVLMDCQMPVMDGYEATRQIRNMPHHNSSFGV